MDEQPDQRKRKLRKAYHQYRKPGKGLKGYRQINLKVKPCIHKLAYHASKRYPKRFQTIQERLRWLLEMDSRLLLGLPLDGPLPAEYLPQSDPPPEASGACDQPA